ncbi:divalent metal cation transporter [Metallosphaera tengchongensis]|uniref:Divalent metal cation transporter n=2 Tax=Metallosphaera tengchongensis TaxID=1532350 RepID=A0A6N0P0Y2_9CREN|nr:divalent metal cation transporter [Metallosphaera tengchongensis]
MDASSTIGAAETGALLKYSLVIFLLLLSVPLYFIQEAAGRIGVATGRGLGDVIRENYSKGLASLMALPMALTDALTYAVEYAGAAVGLAVFGISPLVSVPLVFLLHMGLIVTRKYEHAEKPLLLMSLLLIIGYGLVLAHVGLRDYPVLEVSASKNFLFLVAANVGAVVMPFMLFFQASATAIKFSSIKNLISKREAMKRIRMETALGAIATEALMVIVEMAMAGVDPSTNFLSPESLTKALDSVAGSLSPVFFSVGLVSSAFLALVVISLGSAWGIVEALGISKDKTILVYLFESLPAAVLISTVPIASLTNVILNLLVFFVFTLIGPGVILGLLSSSEKIMGELRNRTYEKIIYWICLSSVVLFGVLSLL